MPEDIAGGAQVRDGGAEETSSAHEMRAEFFRQRAEECAALVKTMTDQLSRRELERTAAHWIRLAEGADLLEHLEQERREREESALRRPEGHS